MRIVGEDESRMSDDRMEENPMATQEILRENKLLLEVFQ